MFNKALAQAGAFLCVLGMCLPRGAQAIRRPLSRVGIAFCCQCANRSALLPVVGPRRQTAIPDFPVLV